MVRDPRRQSQPRRVGQRGERVGCSLSDRRVPGPLPQGRASPPCGHRPLRAPPFSAGRKASGQGPRRSPRAHRRARLRTSSRVSPPAHGGPRRARGPHGRGEDSGGRAPGSPGCGRGSAGWPLRRRSAPRLGGDPARSGRGVLPGADPGLVVDARNDLRELRAQRAPRRLGGDARVSCGEPRTERTSGRRVDAVTHATPPARRLLQRRGIDREATVRPTRSPRSRSRSPRAPTSLLPDLGL